MPAPLRLVTVLGPRWTATTSLAARLSALEHANRLPAGVAYPADAAWFGRTRDGVTTHVELIELSGVSRSATTEPPRPAPVVFAGDVTMPMTTRPPQSRQVVRDRVRRVADDARAAEAHTLLLVAPGSAWAADPAALRRELLTVADSVDIVLPVRRPEVSLAAALAQSVRLADETGERTLSARAALATPERAHEHRYRELLDRWADPTGNVRVLATPVGSDSPPHTLFETLDVNDGSSNDASMDGIRTVVPPLGRDDLIAIAAIARRRSRWGWLPGVRRRADTQLREVRMAADSAATRGAVPFAFTDSERRMLAKRFSRDSAAVRAHVGWQWPDGAPAGPLRDAWIDWFAEE